MLICFRRKILQNYTVFHLHSDLSNGVTNIDSVTKYHQYVELAKQNNMTALGFSEHGSLYEWWHKKCAIEKAGMKYIHSVEAYVTESLERKVRDNYHCVLIAKNYDGFKELNTLITKSFNRKDGHFYYVPRVSIDELLNTSDNIIITTACLGGILHKGTKEIKLKFLKFCIQSKHRCFLEIQHHSDKDENQKKYNMYLANISEKHNIPLIAGTDTHALDSIHFDGRIMLQKGKNVHFDNEDDWDLTFKTYDQLCNAYKKQKCLSEDVYIKAIHNTNGLASMVEEFIISKDIKYPKLYDDPIGTYKDKINKAYKSHPYVKKRYKKSEIQERVNMELDVYEKTNTIDFMLLQNYLREWERENGIKCGYGRGSVSGSEIAYILGITDMDSIKFDLNFFRFMNPSRVTNADIDTDYGSKDRERVKEFLLKDHMGLPQIMTSEIITFNTIALKGAVRDIGRAMDMPLTEVNEICNQCDDENSVIKLREKYQKLFKYVDIVQGTIVSVGTHPSGVLVSDRNISEEIGLCTTSTSKYPISMLNMNELDDLMYVKLDILGLDNIGVINDTCKTLGIDRLNPDNVDLEDMNVWKSIVEDTTLIFQWESNSAQAYLRKFMSDKTIEIAKEKIKDFSMIKWLSFGNGLIRPACASYRDEVAEGVPYDHGLKELNDFLAPTLGYVSMQEDIMSFLVEFCGYSMAESDNVRRGIAKKKGTEKLLPEIKERFVKYTSKKYNISESKCESIIEPFLQVILDASAYAFSWLHSNSYSCIGYICGYLRYYYPLEFLTCALNIFEEKEDKTIAITKYAMSRGIKISPIKFRHSLDQYTFDKETNSIYKGVSSIKYLNKKISKELYKLRDNHHDTFVDLLIDITKISVNSRQLDILIKLDFFSEFGDTEELLAKVEIFNQWYDRKQINKEDSSLPHETMMQFCEQETKKLYKGLDTIGIINHLYNTTKFPKTSIRNKIDYQLEFLGYVQTTIPSLDSTYAYVVDVNSKYKNRVITLYRLNTGETEVVKVKAKQFEESPISKGDIVKTIESSEEKRWKRDSEGGYYQIDERETILRKWSFVN